MSTESAGLWGTPRFSEIFFEVFDALPRQGPGNKASAQRALAMCAGLPQAPAILDLGCGSGCQTFYLAELTSGSITALDSHEPAIARLRAEAARRGLSGRIEAMVGDMADPPVPQATFDLVWSEGALYNIGIEPALDVCARVLKPGGHLVFTDAVWRRDDPPEAVRAGFEADYPGMGRVEDLLALIARSRFELLGHFTLPDEAWWDDFYSPMEARVADLQRKYRDDSEALELLAGIGREPELHRLHSDCYAYEFIVCRLGS